MEGKGHEMKEAKKKEKMVARIIKKVMKKGKKA